MMQTREGVLFIKGSGTPLVRLYKDNAKSWDTFHRVLTQPIMGGSKIALTWPIDLIQKASPTNSDLAVNLQSVFEGSVAAKYLEICPNFVLKATTGGQ